MAVESGISAPTRMTVSHETERKACGTVTTRKSTMAIAAVRPAIAGGT
jgi:hypothetical protein